MALRGFPSAVTAAFLAVSLLAGMQLGKPYLTATSGMTVVGGLLSSFIFVLILSAISSFERHFISTEFQASYPEVIIALATTALAAATIHRVCVTTCILFSLLALFYLSKISSKVYVASHDRTLHHSLSKTGVKTAGKRR